MGPLLLMTMGVSLILFLVTFILATLIKNNGIVDIIWGLGFIVIAIGVYLYSPTPSSMTTLILVTLWGIRLATHLALRNLGKKEDFRYSQWRKQWGRWWLIRSLFQVYLLQWVLMQVVAVPILLTGAASSLSPSWLLAGTAIFVVGFYFEAVGDYQLTLFKAKKANKNKLITTGLWAYTRHPNYFGEALLWWGIALIAYGATSNILAFIGPLMIDFLLLYVSGIPLLEAKYKGRKDWEAYARQTSAFFPLPKQS